MLSVSLGHFLSLCIFIFFVGLYGVLIHRRQILALFLAVEISFVSGLFLLVVFSKYHQNIKGQVFSLFFLGTLMVKIIISISLILSLYKKRGISFMELEKKDDMA